MNGLQQIAGDLIFQNVAHHPCLDGLRDVLILVVLREEDDLGFGAEKKVPATGYSLGKGELSWPMRPQQLRENEC